MLLSSLKQLRGGAGRLCQADRACRSEQLPALSSFLPYLLPFALDPYYLSITLPPFPLHLSSLQGYL